MKLCPFCKERIQNEALKCKHCGEFLTKQENISIIAQYKFPKIWPGYILALLFLIFEIVEPEIIPQTTQQQDYAGWATIPWLVGVIYWFVCVYKTHKTILKATDGHYPISAGAAVGFNFIPFYNLYWIFKWPSEIINFINSRDKSVVLKTWVPGLFLLVAMMAGRLDGTLGLLGMFGVLSYLIRGFKRGLVAQPEPVSYSDKPTPISKGAAIGITCAIAIPILALLAAIAIPNLLRARHNANETAAIATLKECHNMQQNHRKEYFSYETLKTFERNGYIFTTSDVSAHTYRIEAKPKNHGVTGSKVLVIDETGVLTADSKPLEYLTE